MANVDHTILPTGITNHDNSGNTVASQKINVVDEVHKVLGDIPLSEFDTQTSNPNIAPPRGVAATIFVPGRSSQQRGFSTFARPAFIPFKPKSNNPHDVLGVRQGASLKQITAAYKKLVKQYHPDLNQDHKEQATQALQLINNAYDQLKSGQGYDVQDSSATSRRTNPGSWSATGSSESKTKYHFDDYYRQSNVTYNANYDSERLAQLERWMADPNSSYNKPVNIKDAFEGEGRNRHSLELFQKLLKSSSDQDVEEFLQWTLNDNRSFVMNRRKSRFITLKDKELIKLMINKLDTFSEETFELIFDLDSREDLFKLDLTKDLIKKGFDINFDTTRHVPFLLTLIEKKVPLDILKYIIVQGHADLNRKMPEDVLKDYYGLGQISSRRNSVYKTGSSIIDSVEALNAQAANNNDIQSLAYYTSAIKLLKQYGAQMFVDSNLLG